MRLILASSSKNRRDIFDMIGWKYEIIKSDKTEMSTSSNPYQYVIDLSKDKVEVVASQITSSALIIASDSIMYVNGNILEKPKTKSEASTNLKLMSGNVVYAITGITIKDLYKNKEVSTVDVAKVYFKEISAQEINWYIEYEKNIFNCCGFSLEGKAAIFIDKIMGDYNTVRGISVNKLYSMFQDLGYKITDFEVTNN